MFAEEVRTRPARLALAEAMADCAREIALRHWRTRIDVETKSDATPVTAADRAIETAMRDMILASEPDSAILGEEFGADASSGSGDDLWVLDPIDGTGSFITGSPLFGTLIGLVVRGVPQLGVIEVPALGERWTATRGGGASLNGEPCAVSSRQSLAGASLGATSLLVFPEPERQGFLRLADRAALTRFGGDCYAYALVASGHLDLVVEAGLKPYDYLPLAPIIEEAGGCITDWAGQSLSPASDGRVIAAASRELHAEALAVLNG